jgi:hypothetical protein
MKSIQARAKELFPSVLMTLLSIIQALALEFLWGRIHDATALWQLDVAALSGWLQIVTAMVGILQVWLFYVSVVMRFRWIPHARDLLLPFGIGVLEFTFVDLTATPYLSGWLVALAAVYALSAVVAQDMFVRARREPENQEFFGVVTPASRADLVLPLSVIAVYLLLAAAHAVLPTFVWLAPIASLFALVSLLHRLDESRRYWNRSVGLERSD